MTSVQQSDFAAALLNADLARPGPISDGHGGAANKRFDVYRNNVAVSLSDALEASFPVIRKLVGDDFFRAMAGVALRQFPPSTPLMANFGADMPEFLQSFPPVAQLPYLADVARVENAMRASYHAADADALTAEQLQSMDPEVFANTCFCLAPSVRLVSSQYPVGAIWLSNQPDATPQPAQGAEDVIIARPEFDPWVHLLPQGAFQFLSALNGQTPLQTALEIAPDGFDFPATLTLCLGHGVLTTC